MKQKFIIAIATFTYAIVCGVYAVTTLATEPIEVRINIHPGSDPNIINPDADGVIPVLIHGSPVVDVTKIDPSSLKLIVNAFWCASSVATTNKRDIPLCDVQDVGSPNEYSSDSLGPPDGYDDLICQYNNDLGMIREAIQPVTLTGSYLDSGGNESPLIGTDFVSGPGGTEAITVCCIDCNDDGKCGGCNGEIKRCTDIIAVCDGDENCYECTGCKPPEIPDDAPNS